MIYLDFVFTIVYTTEQHFRRLVTKSGHGCTGLANDRVIHIEDDKGNLKITKLISKNANKPSKAKSSSTRKKTFQRITHGLEKELSGYRPDLKVVRSCVQQITSMAAYPDCLCLVHVFCMGTASDTVAVRCDPAVACYVRRVAACVL